VTPLAETMMESAKAVEGRLEELLPPAAASHARVQEAMRYAAFAGGKRLRPFLVLESARLFDVPRDRALQTAAAIEAIHTYSLVHDDLPCMDDDDLRRGLPTTHKAFDEATAVLAGDGLLTAAFGFLADERAHPNAEIRCRLIARLARAAGAEGMIGGQMIDMQAAQNTFTADDVIHLQRLKTGRLFEFSCEAGPVLAEAGDDDCVRLRDYARDMGLVFQITDDLLDVLSTAEKTGKGVGKDEGRGKATLVSLLGVEGARIEARRLAVRAGAALVCYGEKSVLLREFPLSLLDRES
jgi:farnesyl diphosphate synthase